MVNDLIFKTPEEEGLDSEKLLRFLQFVEHKKINLHSFMMIRHGHIIAEGYYKPFHKDFMHRLYSCSKTFVSLAIARMVGEGLVQVEDKIASYIPELIDGSLHKWMQDVTIEDALKMSVPITTDTYYGRDYKEWGWSFFSHPTRSKAVKPGGTIYHYNTSGTFILCVLIEKLTGQTFLEYLRPVFNKIGVSKDIWCVKSPDGYAWGGSGVVCTLRDFAKVGELLLHKGEYKGEQLLPREYMERATSKQISNLFENDYSEGPSAGYGYQVWINEVGYSMYGMGGQFAFCFPDKDFLFVCNGDTQCTMDKMKSYLYEAVRAILYDNLQEGAIETDGKAYALLQEKLDTLELCKDFGEAHSSFEKELDGVCYRLEENSMGWKWFRFDFSGDRATLTYENNRGIKKISFGLGEFVQGTFPETHYYDKQVDVPANRELDALFIANWIEEKKLLLRNYIVDTNFGNCFMTFGFKGNEAGLMFHKRAEFFMEDYAGFAGGFAEVIQKK